MLILNAGDTNMHANQVVASSMWVNSGTEHVPACRLDPRFSWRRYWNYLRRQLFVMDTWAGATNRRINHTMMAAHSYLSWAFTVPATTGRGHALQPPLMGSHFYGNVPHTVFLAPWALSCALYCRQGHAITTYPAPAHDAVDPGFVAQVIACRRHALHCLTCTGLHCCLSMPTCCAHFLSWDTRMACC